MLGEIIKVLGELEGARGERRGRKKGEEEGGGRRGRKKGEG